MMSLSEDNGIGRKEQVDAAVDEGHVERNGEEHRFLEEHDERSSENVLNSS